MAVDPLGASALSMPVAMVKRVQRVLLLDSLLSAASSYSQFDLFPL